MANNKVIPTTQGGDSLLNSNTGGDTPSGSLIVTEWDERSPAEPSQTSVPEPWSDPKIFIGLFEDLNLYRGSYKYQNRGPG